MDDRLRQAPFRGSLGTVFAYREGQDTILIATEEGARAEVPAPDLRELLELLAETGGSTSYDGTFERVRREVARAETSSANERIEANSRLAELLALPRAERAAKVTDDPRFQTYHLAALALERSRAAVYDDPARSRELAALGQSIAQNLSPGRYAESRVRVLQAFSHAVHGNALRVAGDLRGALQAFQQARLLCDPSTHGSLEIVEIGNLEVSLLRDIRDFPSALERSTEVVAGYLRAGMVPEAAKAMLTRATIYEILDDQEKNLSTLREAAEMVPTHADPWVALMVRHSLTFGLARAGRLEQASRMYAETVGLYEQFPAPWVTARRDWVRGLIEEGSGETEAAIRSLERARSTFTAHGYGMDAALVALDLAAVLAESGHAEEVVELAAASYKLLESQGVHQDALAALAQFEQAAARQTLDRALIRTLTRKLKRAEELRTLAT